MDNVYLDEIYDSDADSISDDLYYEAEEPSRSRFNLVICELYNREIHGETDNNSGVEYHYIVNSRFKKFDLIDVIENDYIFMIRAVYMHLNNKYIYSNNKNVNKTKFRNYPNIIRRNDYIKPEIAECIYLSGDEYVAIIKTHWIRLIQRTWKKIYKQKMETIKNMRSIYYLNKREINNKHILTLPTLKGMLSYLS